MERHDVGRHDVGRHDVGRHDVGRHDVGRHDVGRHDVGRHDVGRHDVGRHDVGRHDLGQRAVAVIGRARLSPALLVSLALVGVAFALPPGGPAHLDGVGAHVSWPLLAALFAGAEIAARRVHVRKDDARVSLSEIPVVLGLFLAAPAALLAGRVVGSAVAFASRRQSPRKLVFNTALVAAETAVTVAVFTRLAGGSGLEPGAWLAAGVATSLSGALSRLLVQLVVHAEEGTRLSRADLVGSLRHGALAVPVTVIGLVAVCALQPDPRRVALLAAAAVVVLAAHRRYGLLSDRHDQVQQLVRFTDRISRPQPVADVLQTAADLACVVLRAERAVLVLAGTVDEQARLLRVTGGAAGSRLGDHPGRAGRGRPPGRRGVPGHQRPGPARVPRPARAAGRAAGSAVHRGRAARRARRGRPASAAALVRPGRRGAARDARGADRAGARQQPARRTGCGTRRCTTGSPGSPTAPCSPQALSVAAQEAEPDAPVAVLLIDLDGFKQVNDTLGHALGDQLLRVVAERLDAVVGADGLVARLGGDEFAVVLSLGSAWQALDVAGRIARALREPVPLHGTDARVSGSIGVTLSPHQGRDPSALLRYADTAMYAAKRAGTGVQLYSADLVRPAERPGSPLGADRRGKPAGPAPRVLELDPVASSRQAGTTRRTP